MPNPEIIQQPACATQVMSATGLVTRDEARVILRTLAQNGFFVAPFEPTNSMFDAYIGALNHPSRLHKTIIAHIGKARARWKAMANAGLKVAFSDREDTGERAAIGAVGDSPPHINPPDEQ